MRSGSPWTDRAVECLREAVTAGLSASQIAARLTKALSPEVPFTRNAIISKCGREGIRLLVDHATRKSQKRRLTPPVERRAPPRKRRPQKPPQISAELAPPSKIGLLELTSSMCRWPIGVPGEEGFHFCGAEKVRGSYCGYHVNLAYRTVARTDKSKRFMLSDMQDLRTGSVR